MVDQANGVMIYRPEPSSRHPLVLIFLAFIAFYGVSVVAGGPPPGSISEQLDPIQVQIWGASLGFGAFSYLIALSLQSSRRVRPFTIGVAFEQVGAASLGVAAILYSAAIMTVAGWLGALPAGFTLAFGVACLYRWISILLGIRAFAAANA